MATLELSIDTRYVPDWGTWEAIREILQNAKDADDLGCPMRVSYSKNTQTLTISNRGADLTRNTLLLGSTTKVGSTNQRGQFGEGYKLALLALVRQGIMVTVRTRTEVWTPKIAPSERFDGVEVLSIQTRARRTPSDSVQFVIKGVTPEAWEEVQGNCLFLRAAHHTIVTHNGRILCDPQYASQLFVMGLYVGRLPEHYLYGYDLNDVRLDRDRKLAEPWSLRYAIAKAIEHSAAAGTLDVAEVLNARRAEVEALAANVEVVPSTTRLAANRFDALYGIDSVPVSSDAKAREVQHHGLRPVVMSPHEVRIIEAARGTSDQRLALRNLNVKQEIPLEVLTPKEHENFQWALKLVLSVTPIQQTVRVVEFQGHRIWGTHTSQYIRIARSRLQDRVDLMSTLVHEVAHDYGSDGDVAHTAAIQRIFAEICAKHVDLTLRDG